MPSASQLSPASGSTGEERFDGAVRLHLQGELDAALRAYDSLLAKWPGYAEAHNNAGTIRAQRGERDRALVHFRRAAELQPDYAEAHHNEGLARLHGGDAAAAIAPLQRAVDIRPDRADWCTDLANALIEEQRCDEALVWYDRALALTPRNVTALSNRAVALRGLRRHPEAIAACHAALALKADHLDTLNNLGIILKEARDFDEARRVFERALTVSPESTPVRVNLAVLLMELNRHDEARAIAQKLITERPDALEAWNVLGNCAFEAGNFDLAEAHHRKVLARDAGDRNANWNLAVITLLRGDLAEGFRRFESRKRLVSVVFTRRRFTEPEWDGSPLAGRTIFVHAEQGLGDAIQFVRYAALLKARGAGRVIVESSEAAAGLLRTAPGVDAVVTPGAVVPPFDVHAYLMSLPLLCGTALENIPSRVPYLSVPHRPVARLIRETPARVRVGLVWAGNALHQRDLIRSIPLEMLEPVVGTPQVAFFSLQKGPAARQLTTEHHSHVVNLDPMLNDWGDTAAAVAELDLVISVDTSVAHLAGALGKPVWILLPHVPDWRWMLGRQDSPWYPTMRLFRQRAPGDWMTVMTEVSAALAGFEPGVTRQVTPAVTPIPVAAPAVDTSARIGTSERRPIAIGWPVGLTSGWGTYGLQLALALRKSTRAEPVLTDPPTLEGIGPLAARQVLAMRREVPGARSSEVIRLLPLGNHIQGPPRIGLPPAGRHVGVIFFEDTTIDRAAVERARAFDTIVTGSTWNTEMLRAHGISHVRMVLQGVDPSLFHLAPRTGILGDRFTVFSGGKLEFRKGQDIVVEAFRRFHAKHPDALLVTAWHNHWPRTMDGIDAAGYVRGTPAVRNGRCEVTEWLGANGVSPDAVFDLGLQPQTVMAQVLREMDVAVFTNRCEGGTNLVAMEAMACGVPTILSANTGHLNLIGRDTCFPLERQDTVSARSSLYRGTLGWGESDPAEVVEYLERAYDDHAEAQRRGLEGAALLAQLPWEAQADELLRQLDF
ncbi:MAG: tetratricopeptide repeat protein [Gemmatimonadales bacterium]